MARTVFRFGRYRLDVVPGPEGQFLWVLRDGGVDLARSDILFTTEDAAAAGGFAAVTRILGPDASEVFGPLLPHDV